MGRFIARHPASTYFALTFAISWAGVLPTFLASGGIQATAESSQRWFIYALAAMLAGPTIAGILMTAALHGMSGLRALLTRVTMWRVGVWWYAVAILTAPMLMLATLFALSLISPAFIPGIFTTSDRTTLLLASLGVGLSAGIFEEIGWTGFAIPTLRRRSTLLATGLIVGALWGAWHLLTNVLWAANVSAGDLPLAIYLPASIVAVLIGYLPAFRVLMVWVYERTGSVFIAMLMHVSLTTSVIALTPTLAGVPLLLCSYAIAATMWIVVAAIAILNRRRASPRPLRQAA